jgi:hypothetical protein
MKPLFGEEPVARLSTQRGVASKQARRYAVGASGRSRSGEVRFGLKRTVARALKESDERGPARHLSQTGAAA